MCPVASCKAGPLKKLSNHLKQKYANLTREAHRLALSSAKVVNSKQKAKAPLIMGQLSIKQYTRERVEPQSESEGELVHLRGMRHFPMCTVGTEEGHVGLYQLAAGHRWKSEELPSVSR